VNSRQIEIAVAKMFGYRQNLIIPNVSWGFFDGFEVDLLIVRPSLWAIEIEIKTTAGDIKRDALKNRHRDAKWYPQGQAKIQRKYFAVPLALADHQSIPADVGVIGVTETGAAFIKRPAPLRKGAVKISASEERALLRLAHMRVWTMKEALETGLQRKSSTPPSGDEKSNSKGDGE
jgi:hypothetical protein